MTPSPRAAMAALQDTGQCWHEHPRTRTHISGELRSAMVLNRENCLNTVSYPVTTSDWQKRKQPNSAKGWQRRGEIGKCVQPLETYIGICAPEM